MYTYNRVNHTCISDIKSYILSCISRIKTENKIQLGIEHEGCLRMNRENARAVNSKILKGRNLPRSRVLHPGDSTDLWQKDLTPYHLGAYPSAVLGAYLWGQPVRSSRSSSQQILPAFTRASEHGGDGGESHLILRVSLDHQVSLRHEYLHLPLPHPRFFVTTSASTGRLILTFVDKQDVSNM